MIKRIKNCFGNELVNSGRQMEMDVAKGIAIIFMVFSHAFEIMAWFFDPEISMELSYGIFDRFLGGVFAAPVFMFCMGIGIYYSRKNSAADLLRRAIGMVGIALLLEICRTAIPGFLEWLIFRDPGCIEYVYIFFNVDILQFAAMALFVFALFKKLNLKPAHMLVIAVVFSLAGQLLQDVSTGSYIGDMAAGFLWHSYEGSYFPLLNWLIFPVCGYAVGSVWQRLRDKEAFYRLITPISWAITAVYFASMGLMKQWYFLSGGYYYGLGILDALFAVVVCFAMIGLGYYLLRWAGCAARWLSSMGSRVNSLYCIHWTIYGFLYLAVACITESYLPQWIILPTGAAVLIVSDLLSRQYKKLRQKKQ